MATTQTYKCISSNAHIKSKASLFASNLGTLKKDSLIEIISIRGSWAYFKYNNKDAYILTMYLQKVQIVVTGSITIRYLNTDTKAEIASSIINSNLTLKSYTYTAPSFANYTVVEPSTKSVTLTASNLNQEVIFYYKENKIYGSITINYIDKDTGLSIAPTETHNNVELGTYSYNSIAITGYKLSSVSSQSVTLTKDTYNQTIIFEYTKILGTVYVKHLDVDTKTEIATTESYSNLELKAYSYKAKSIDGYIIVEPSSKTITLTSSDYNQNVVFYYKANKIYGSIAISYIEKGTNTSISPSVTNSNLELGAYSYNSIDITGYQISGASSKSVTLTKEMPNQTITFEYTVEKATDPLDPSKQNEVPYISTYYIKPIVKPNEEVIIDYYITDYYHKEYVSEDFSETFTVTVRIEGKDDIIVKNLKAGDQSISLGTFPKLDGQEQKFSILCTDQYGRNSHELFNFFLVRNDVPVKEYVMTAQDLTTYNISNTNDTTKIAATRQGLQKLLDDKQAQGFNKLRLLAGTYIIDYLAPIYIPTKFTLDMNGSTLKLHEFTGSGALMIELNNTFDSHVINGIIEGDFYNHDYTNSPNNSEWVNGISIGGESKYSSYENLTVKDITGYGTINGIKNSRDNKLGYTYLAPRPIGNTFKLGDIDKNTGLDISSTNRTTCDFRDISGYSDIGYLSVSLYLGYQGNPSGTWNLICHFYDEFKIFIKSTDAYQYRRVAVPANAKFMRVTILNEAYPDNLSIQLFRLPTNCSFKNLKLDNCRAVGMAPQGMNNMLFENCELSKCGTSVTKCALDAEDGWDMMQDCTFRKFNFHDNPYSDFLTCAGHNFIIENQINGDIYIWERTKDLVIRNSNCKRLSLRYTENLVRHGIYRVYNNTIISGNINGNICRNIQAVTSIGGIVYNSTMSALSSNSIYTNCTINVSSGFLGYFSEIQMDSCNFILDKNFTSAYKLSFNYATGNKCTFKHCHFYGKSILANHNGFYSGHFDSCIFDDLSIEPNVVATETDEIIFTNCTINSSNEYLIKYSPFSYTQGTYTKLAFDNCTISGTSNLKFFAYGYAKPANGFLKLNNCTLTLPSLTVFFDCTTNNFEYIQNFNIILINTPITNNISMLSENIKKYNSNNITLKIS